MTVVRSLAPAPRRNSDDPEPTVRDAERLLRAAGTVAGSSVPGYVPCAGADDCRRPGTLSVVTADATTRLCAMHAMTAVFTTPDLLALVKPGE